MIDKTTPLRALLLGLAAAPLAAQAAPANFSHSEANSRLTVPFGTTTVPYRYLQVHDDMEGRPGTLHGFSLRRDGTITTASPANTVIVDVFVSTAVTTSKAPSKVFDDNHGTDKLQVATFKTVQFPATVHGGLGAPFEFRIPFDKPFPFAGGGPLCWEVRVNGRQGASSIYFDAVSGANTNPSPGYVAFGAACKSSQQTSVLAHSTAANPNWAGGSIAFSFTVRQAPKNGLCLLALGVDDKAFGPFPLPLELPGTRNEPSKACFLHIAPLLYLPLLTDASGTGTFQYALPATLEMNGFKLHSQVLAPDAAANTIGVVMSNYVTNQWVAPFKTASVGYVGLSGSLGTTGTASPNIGMVVRFD